MERDIDLDVHVEKKDIVKRMFIETADDNYVAARWCFIQRLCVDFFWLATHAVEKYLKAMLLLNGRSAKRHGHDIVSLYSDLSAMEPDLLPKTLTKPDLEPLRGWFDEPTIKFVERLYRNGNADNRYQVFGFVQRDGDLFKLDQVVFAVRRLCRPLDERVTRTGITQRELLEKGFWEVNGKLEKALKGDLGVDVQTAALNLNMPFAPGDYDHTGFRAGWSGSNPVLVRTILRPIARGGRSAEVATRVRDWLLDNVKLPSGVVEELKAAAPPR